MQCGEGRKEGGNLDWGEEGEEANHKERKGEGINGEEELEEKKKRGRRSSNVKLKRRPRLRGKGRRK